MRWGIDLMRDSEANSMEMDTGPRPIVLLGPTAGGKSAVAVGLAQAQGGQVIGADSMQVYRHMDVGTAKPTTAQRRQVAHHLVDIVEPTQRFTVADWLGRVEPLIEQIQAAGGWPIVVGGTNLYIKALLEGMFDGPGHDPGFRHQAASIPSGQLHQQLQAIDPEAAQRIHPNDQKKIVRALEVYHATGQPISHHQRQWDQPAAVLESPPEADTTTGLHPTPGYRYNPILIGLAWPTQAINRRINQRVKAMFYPDQVSQEIRDQLGTSPGTSHSLLQEVQWLQAEGLLGPQASQALGYKQVLDHLLGRCTLDEAFEKTKVLTRRFAKSQRTWLRRFRPVKWLAAADRTGAELIDEAVDYVHQV